LQVLDCAAGCPTGYKEQASKGKNMLGQKDGIEAWPFALIFCPTIFLFTSTSTSQETETGGDLSDDVARSGKFPQHTGGILNPRCSSRSFKAKAGQHPARASKASISKRPIACSACMALLSEQSCVQTANRFRNTM
jgi:hypothetical protein